MATSNWLHQLTAERVGVALSWRRPVPRWWPPAPGDLRRREFNGKPPGSWRATRGADVRAQLGEHVRPPLLHWRAPN